MKVTILVGKEPPQAIDEIPQAAEEYFMYPKDSLIRDLSRIML